MASQRLASSVARNGKPQTRVRTATVIDLLPPFTDEVDNVTGWQVLLDFGGSEVKRAGIASSYDPVPGDKVIVATYRDALFVIGKVVAGESGDAPGKRVAYAYVQTPGTYATAAASASDVALTPLTVTVAMKAGAAYSVRLRTGYSGATATSWAFFRLRQDAANSGIDLGEYFRAPVASATSVFGFDQSLPIRNDTGVDLSVVIVPTLTASSVGSASAFCTAQSRAFVEVSVLGSSKMYPYAAAVSAPVIT